MRICKLAIFHGAGESFTLERVEVPALQPGQILVRNEYTTICRSDLNTFSGKREEKTPTILGHEVAGTIEDVAEGRLPRDCRGSELQRGDRVTWAIYSSNPKSALSRRGIPQKADGLFKYGHEQLTVDQTLHGGLSEYCILRANTPVVRTDILMPLQVTALINCAVATVAGSLRLAEPIKNGNVIIAGAGMLGVVACAMSRCAGTRRIIALDIDETRLKTATRFGADITLNLRTLTQPLAEWVAANLADEMISTALDFSGAPETAEGLVDALGIGGTAVFVGATFPQRAMQIKAEQLIRRILTIRGLHNYNEADFLTAVEFMEQNHSKFPFQSLIYDGFDLDSVNEAFRFAMESNVYRVGLRIGRNGEN